MAKNRISNHIIPSLLLLDGVLCVFLAIFAFTLGLDPDPDWGKMRFVLFFMGFALCCTSVFLFSRNSGFANAEKIKRIFLFTHICFFIFFIYAWFITFGTFTQWRASTHYYSLLADAFGKGQLHVDVDPGQALLNTEDPYSSEDRPGFGEDVWDLSLYKGKLYLYWGPIPALLLTPVQLLLGTSIRDMYLVYFFLCGLLIFNSLIILKIWDLFFFDMPVRYVILSIFLIGLILPILWALNIPDVYEAAIGAGQFFLIGGIYFIILALEKDFHKGYLFMGGLFWACSVGSRAINVFPIAFLTGLTLFWIWKIQNNARNWHEIIQLAGTLITPLIFGGLVIAWYNWARFDSPIEFGLRYQITIYNLNRDSSIVFHPDYLPFNIYAYVFQPFEFISKFPFLQPVNLSRHLNSLNVIQPKLYASGRVVGFLFYAPCLLMAFVPFLSRRRDTSLLDEKKLQIFVVYLLGGSFLISFITLLFYFYGQMRFLGDFISQLTMLAIIGYWSLLRSSRTSKIFIYLVSILILITIIASFLLSFSSETSRMEKFNPALMERINLIIPGR